MKDRVSSTKQAAHMSGPTKSILPTPNTLSILHCKELRAKIFPKIKNTWGRIFCLFIKYPKQTQPPLEQMMLELGVCRETRHPYVYQYILDTCTLLFIPKNVFQHWFCSKSKQCWMWVIFAALTIFKIINVITVSKWRGKERNQTPNINCDATMLQNRQGTLT